MNGDSEALLLSCDSSLPSTIISPSNTKTEHQQSLLFMEESDATTTNYTDLITSTTNDNNNSGLLRYRSAPSSLIENYISGVEKSTGLNSRFCSDHEANGAEYGTNNNKACSQLPPQYPRHNGNQFGSMGMGHLQGPVKMGSGLMRQNSSPAGFFSQNGYVASTRGIGSYRMGDGGANGPDLSPSSSRLRNNTMNFSSGMLSSLGILSRIAEVDEAKAGNNSVDSLFYGPGFEFGPWNDTSNFGENFTTGIKRELDNDLNLFPHLQGEPENRPHILSHHLSLPKNSAEMANVEKLLHFQDTIPCKIRAKRGCATHPRSIAERVRRTKISERMRKLQDLVPNMDKQTNTAEMLDLAVEYIKNLQNEYKTLSENRANCKCLPSQKTVLNQ